MKNHNNSFLYSIFIKFRYSEKVIKIWPMFHSFITSFCSFKLLLEYGPNLCGHLRMFELKTTTMYKLHKSNDNMLSHSGFHGRNLANLIINNLYLNVQKMS